MRISRIYTDQTLTAGGRITVDGATASYIARVLRLRAGTPLTIFNGKGGEYAAVLTALGKHTVECELREFDPVEREAAITLVLLQGIARGDRMDTIIQKATELGVARIVPVLTERSVVKLAADVSERKHAHWRSIAISACEQCGRNRIPTVDAAATPEQACRVASLSACKALLDPDAHVSLGDLWCSAGVGSELCLLIGPEGGLTQDERDIAAREGFEAAHLGARVLRTETAALAALTVAHALTGDFRRSAS